MKRFHLPAWMTLGILFTGAAYAATPDFSGVWERYPDLYTSQNTRFLKEPPPPGGGPQLKEPYASAYKALLKRRESAAKRGEQVIDAITSCLPEGMPTIMGATYNIELLQSPQVVVVLAELFTQTRRIFLNEKMPPLDEITPSYNGYSVGRWEGDTLVVETRKVREDVKFEPFGIPHSLDMKITERLRLTGPGLLENRITIEDPAALAKPYVFTFGYKKDPGYKVLEYICDNNRYRSDEKGNATLDLNSK